MYPDQVLFEFWWPNGHYKGARIYGPVLPWISGYIFGQIMCPKQLTFETLNCPTKI